MRRVLAAGLALVCVAMLSSCSLLTNFSGTIIDNSGQVSEVQMHHIADAVKNHDAGALRKLFSPVAREKATDLDSGLKYFLSFFPSGHMTWESQGVGSSDDNEHGKRTVELYSFYKVSANGKKYELYFADFTVNQVEDPHNVGIYALGVTPINAHPASSPNPASDAFYTWANSRDIENDKLGGPGVYVPQK